MNDFAHEYDMVCYLTTRSESCLVLVNECLDYKFQSGCDDFRNNLVTNIAQTNWSVVGYSCWVVYFGY